jgi:Helicase associated domain
MGGRLLSPETVLEPRGHCRIPFSYKTDDGCRLGQWVGNQRANKESMDPNRRQRLEGLPGWSWDALTDQWEEGFSHLKQFSEQEGHCRVPAKHKTGNGYRLGMWVSVQRTEKETMNPDRRQRLQELPNWSWNVRTDQWEEGFSYLKQFFEQEGHCRVAAQCKSDDGYRLGQWVVVQRREKDVMDPDRRQRLETLPGWVWDAISDQWEDGFSHLKQFSKKVGHCRVAKQYKTEHGYRLGYWVSNQRVNKESMDPNRRQRLEELPGWSWGPHSDQWEEGFSYLKQFLKQEGHCRVPQSYRTDDGYRLGQWVRVQRGNVDTISPDRRHRLEALPSWIWEPLSNQWEEGFSHLKQFSEREGHCRVPDRYGTDDGCRLGQWVGNQRAKRGTMETDRRQRLEALPGWVWTVEK